jgi:GNAT superfamily N-acetyltransferase
MNAVKAAETDTDIVRVFSVMRELRPHIASESEFLSRVRRQQQTQPGWRLIYIEADGVPVAAASFRVMEMLAWGRALYVDDIITREDKRGRGFAGALMRWMEDFARSEGCAEFHLDSATHRHQAHRLYHRMGLPITSFHFGRKL